MHMLGIDLSLRNASVAAADANNGNSLLFMFDKPDRARPAAMSLLRSTQMLNRGNVRTRSYAFRQTRHTAFITCHEM